MKLEIYGFTAEISNNGLEIIQPNNPNDGSISLSKQEALLLALWIQKNIKDTAHE